MTTRRRLLQAAAITPLSLQLASHALAEGDEQPNVIFNFFPNGAAPDYFFPTANDAELPPMTAPLSSVRDECSFVDGISLYGANGEQTQRLVLTAGSDHSIDNVIAAAMNQRGQLKRPVPNIRLGAASNTWQGFSNSYAAGQMLAHEDNPRLAYGLLFGNGPSREDARNQTELRHTVGTDAAQLVEQQLDALNTLDLKIPPLNLRGLDANRDFSRYDNSQDLATFVDLQQDILVMALSTGLSHVASLMIGHADWQLAPFGPESDQRNAYGQASGQAQIPYVAWYMERLAKLLAKLRVMPGVSRGSLLDETYVVTYSNIGKLSDLSFDRLPMILAGGQGFTHKPSVKDYKSSAEPLAGVWASTAQVANVPLENFGEAYTAGGKGNGPIYGLWEA